MILNVGAAALATKDGCRASGLPRTAIFAAGLAAAPTLRTAEQEPVVLPPAKRAA
jgi:hypothetical protein